MTTRSAALVVIALAGVAADLGLVSPPARIGTPLAEAVAAVESWQEDRAASWACTIRTARALEGDRSYSAKCGDDVYVNTRNVASTASR